MKKCSLAMNRREAWMGNRCETMIFLKENFTAAVENLYG